MVWMSSSTSLFNTSRAALTEALDDVRLAAGAAPPLTMEMAASHSRSAKLVASAAMAQQMVAMCEEHERAHAAQSATVSLALSRSASAHKAAMREMAGDLAVEKSARARIEARAALAATEACDAAAESAALITALRQ